MKHHVRSVVLAAALLAGCSTLKVDLDYDPTRDFTAYHTYAWMPAPANDDNDTQIRNDLVEARIVNAVDTALAQKNLAKADSNSADVLVTYHINVEKRIDVQTIDTGFGYRPWWHWNTSLDTETVVREYKAGTLVLDIIDRKSNRLTWRAAAETRLRQGLTPAERDSEIRNIVNELLARFPPSKATP